MGLAEAGGVHICYEYCATGQIVWREYARAMQSLSLAGDGTGIASDWALANDIWPAPRRVLSNHSNQLRWPPNYGPRCWAPHSWTKEIKRRRPHPRALRSPNLTRVHKRLLLRPALAPPVLKRTTPTKHIFSKTEAPVQRAPHHQPQNRSAKDPKRWRR